MTKIYYLAIQWMDNHWKQECCVLFCGNELDTYKAKNNVVNTLAPLTHKSLNFPNN